MNPVIYEILRWVQNGQKEDNFLLLFNPIGAGETPIAMVQWVEDSKKWQLTRNEPDGTKFVCELEEAETLEDAIDEAERLVAVFFEDMADYYTQRRNAFQEGLRTLHSIINKKCSGCRWRALRRYQKCSCCARNYRNLKDLYEKEKE